MRHALLWLAVAAGACIEYEPVGETNYQPPLANPEEPQSPRAEDRIVQVTTPEVDVLFVVDNSGSMRANQENLAANFPAFLSFFLGSGLDYHIAVTSTDAGISDDYCSGNNALKGALKEFNGYRWVDENTVDPEAVFNGMSSLGVTGSGCEQGLATSYLALETLRDTTNAGFQRDTASVHTIVLSDEQDQSEDYQPVHITLDEYKPWYSGLKTLVEDRSFSAIVCTERTSGLFSACPIGSAGTRYAEVVGSVGGMVADITADDFAVVLEELGLRASGYRREYFLSQIPVVETLEVKIEQTNGATAVMAMGPEAEGGEFEYDEVRNAIEFHSFIPEALDTVVISYVLLSASQDPQFETEAF